MAERAFVAVGSNLGDRRAFLAAGLQQLVDRPGIQLERASSLYETAPVGYLDQPSFLNAVFSVSAGIPPFDLLRIMQRIERRYHRQRRIHWGPRTLDLDLLLYGDCRISAPDLNLPHPHIAERLFVLAPLCEIAPDLRHPVTGHTFSDSLAALEDSQQIRRIAPFPLPQTTSPVA